MGLLSSFTSPNRPRAPLLIAGRWYDVCSTYGGLENGQVAVAALTLYASPIVLERPTSIDRIGINVTIAAAAGKLARMMVYGSGANGLPGSLLVDGGTVLVDATGDRTVTVAATLPAGLVYAAIVSDGAPTLQFANIIYALVPFGFATPTPAAAGGGSPQRAVGDITAPNPWGAPSAYTANTWVRVGIRAV